MKANFALSLSFEGIGLRHRGPEGWHDLGRVPLEAPDLDDRLRDLRDAAADIAPEGLASDLVLPDDQILYRHLTDVPDAAPAVAAALEGLTPYAVADLVFDWQPHPAGGVVVAAVARETLAEAGVFARQHGFAPVAFTADPGEDKPFRGAPDFGPASVPAKGATAPDRAAPMADRTDPSPSDGEHDGDSPSAPEPAETEPSAAATANGDHPAGAQSDQPRSAEPAPETSPGPAFSTRRPAGDGVDGPDPSRSASPGETAGTLVLTQVARRLGPFEIRGTDEDRPTTAAAPETAVAPETAAAPQTAGGTETAADAETTAEPETAAEPEIAAAQPPVKLAPSAAPAASPDLVVVRDAVTGPSTETAPRADALGPAAPAKARSGTTQTHSPGGSSIDKAFPIAVAIKPKSSMAPKKPAGQVARRVPPGVRVGPLARMRKDAQSGRTLNGSVSVGAATRPSVGAGVTRIAIAGDAVRASGAGFVPREPSIAGGPGIARLLPVSPVVLGLVVALVLALAAAVGLSRIVVGWLEPPVDLPSIAADAPMVAILPPISADIPPPDAQAALGPALDAVEPAPEPAASETADETVQETVTGTVPETVAAEPETVAALPNTEADRVAVTEPPAGPAADAAQGDPDLTANEVAALALPAEDTAPPTGTAVSPAEALLPPVAADEPAGPGTLVTRADPDAERDLAPFTRSDPGIAQFLPGQPTRPAQTDAAPVAPSQFVQGPGPAPVDLPAPLSAAGAVPAATRFILAALDTQVTAQEPYLLAPPSASESGREPQAAQPLPLPGTVFALDARGLVAAVPEGALSPDGHLVTLGRPVAVPPSRPLVVVPAPALAEDPAEVRRLAAIRPLARPTLPARDPLATADSPQTDPAPLSDPAVDAALAEALATPADAAAAQPPPVPAGPVLPGLRPPPRPVSVTPAPGRAPETADDATAPRIIGATPRAVVASLRPTARPSGFDANVAAALVRVSPAPDTSSAARAVPASAPATAELDYDDGEPELASASRAPQIPSSASVARQATVSNAINLRQINLIGVYGTSSDRSALIRLSNGRFVKVQVGDRVDGGQIAAIGERELRYVKGGQNHVLSMPRG